MYAAVLPAKDHKAVICSTQRASEVEVNGQIVLRVPSSENVDLPLSRMQKKLDFQEWT
jgi:hypothetical protein